KSPKHDWVSFNVKQILDSQATHSFNSETLKYLYSIYGVTDTPTILYPHDAVLYLRFPESQLQQLKSCQLQVVLVNEKEFSVLKNASLLQHPSLINRLTSLTTAQQTWIPSNFGKGGIFKGTWNLLQLNKKYGWAEVNQFWAQNPDLLPGEQRFDPAFVNYRLMLNYVNHFHYVVNEVICGDKPHTFQHRIATVKVVGPFETQLEFAGLEDQTDDPPNWCEG